MFYLFAFVKTCCFFFVRPELLYSVLKPYQSKTNDILKSCGTDNACAHSVSCQLPNSLRKKTNPIFFSIFNPDLLQVLSIRPVANLNFLSLSFFPSTNLLHVWIQTVMGLFIKKTITV